MNESMSDMVPDKCSMTAAPDLYKELFAATAANFSALAQDAIFITY